MPTLKIIGFMAKGSRDLPPHQGPTDYETIIHRNMQFDDVVMITTIRDK